MNEIAFPMAERERGAAVADLQDALQLLLDRGALLPNDEAARREMFNSLKRERATQTYGSAMSRLVGILQEERRLRVSGEVDQRTADALNALLIEWGLLERTDPPKSFVFIDGTRQHQFRIRGSLS